MLLFDDEEQIKPRKADILMENLYAHTVNLNKIVNLFTYCFFVSMLNYFFFKKKKTKYFETNAR